LVQNLLSSSLLSKNLKIKIYRNVSLPVVSSGPTLRKECRLRVFENKLFRRIFGHKRVEVTGEWGKLHKEDLNDLYCSPNIVRAIKLRMRWAGHGTRMGEWRGVYRVGGET